MEENERRYGETCKACREEIWMSNFIIALVRLYRKAVSPFIPPSCIYTPTCSAYAEEALKKHGAVKGSAFAVKRILRCHPWHSGGYDPVPEVEKDE